MIFFVPVEVLLSTFDLPFIIGSLFIQLLSSIVDSSSFLQPIGDQDAAAVRAIAAEAAVLLVWEVEEAFIWLVFWVLSTTMCLQGVLVVL